MNNIYYQDKKVTLYKGDCLEVLKIIPKCSVDLIFADPPYHLSNGGITCHAGRMVSVNKGDWDRSNGIEVDHKFDINWLSACRRVLKDNGTIWISGTMHKIYSIGFALQKLGYKMLNDICWYKPNAAPNLSARYFTHSHETVIWAAKSEKSKHKFNYSLMKKLANGKQMRSLWTGLNDADEIEDIWPITTPSNGEKSFGKHPTQKPVSLMERIILASSEPGDIILDPFTGSSTTGIAAIRHGLFFIGIDNNTDFLELSVRRLKDEENKIENNPQFLISSV